MKRAVACLAVCSLLLLAGAGHSQQDSITIWWAQWAPADALQALGNDFQKETGIGVKVHQIP